ncbi:nucleotidyltransferase domain-containing protein [Acidiphilium sp.]|uniref:nucleotidyltransferase domain-containing protein n=1 Tax=Acidiphilium sp. TaxID=527 RepID=UPI003CFFEAE3
MKPDRIIQRIAEWVQNRPEIQAAALVGSQARGMARPESDIDLVLLVTAPETFKLDVGWLHEINWGVIGTRPTLWVDEDYGALWSRRLWLEPDGDEIEFGFALPAWAETRRIDPGTRRVIADGCRILHDPQGLFSRLCIAVCEQVA